MQRRELCFFQNPTTLTQILNQVASTGDCAQAWPGTGFDNFIGDMQAWSQ
jgi:hypothetical protein